LLCHFCANTISPGAKRAFSNPTFFDLSENWHIEKKNTLIFILTKKSPTQNYSVANLSLFQIFCIILYLITQRTLIVKTSAWVRWKGILLRKI
jgi:hypothetical protein